MRDNRAKCCHAQVAANAAGAADQKGQVGARCQCSRAIQEWKISRGVDPNRDHAMLQGIVEQKRERKHGRDQSMQ